MRKFTVSYYAERNDECTDLEIDVECNSIWDVKETFEKQVRLYKRIYEIKEI